MCTFDPPYRLYLALPSFTSYTKSGFSDFEQKSLLVFVTKYGKQGKFHAVNSDPSAVDPPAIVSSARFITSTQYVEYTTNRAINSNGEGRKKINEILVMVY